MHFNKESLGYFWHTMLANFMYLSPPPNLVEVLFFFFLMQEPLPINDKE